jgi:hypothetical protein
MRLARREGLPPIRLHDLRHGTAITVSLQKVRDNARRPAVLVGHRLNTDQDIGCTDPGILRAL